MKRFLAILVLAAAALTAQTASISDTLTAAAGGGAWTGRITISLNNAGAAQPLYSGTTSLAGWSRTLCLGVTGSDCASELSAGVVTITLYANDSITPAGTSYSARFVPTRGSAWVETWTVTAGDTKLYEIRATTVPTPTTTFTAGQIALAAGRLLYGNASGVATPLPPGANGDVLTLSGGYPTWAVGAGNGTWGSITGTLSSQTDLQSALDGKLATNGNAATATALASNPTDCSAGQYATAIAASGNLTCGQVSFAELSGTSGLVLGADNLTSVGAIPYVSAAGILNQDSTALFWDAANNRLGVGTATPTAIVQAETSSGTGTVYGFFAAISGSAATNHGFYASVSGAVNNIAFRAANPQAGANNWAFYADSPAKNYLSGSLLIGTTTDSNFKLDVATSGSAGTMRVYDATATTGRTQFLLTSGANQSTVPLLQIQSPTYGVRWDSAAGPIWVHAALDLLAFQTRSLGLGSSGVFAWSNTVDSPQSTKDLSLSRASAGVLQVGNGGSNANGEIQAKIHTWINGTEPTCNSTTRGKVVMVQGGAGVADTLRVCRKDAADAYAWTALY